MRYALMINIIVSVALFALVKVIGVAICAPQDMRWRAPRPKAGTFTVNMSVVDPTVNSSLHLVTERHDGLHRVSGLTSALSMSHLNKP
jgi:hypothetical protein